MKGRTNGQNNPKKPIKSDGYDFLVEYLLGFEPKVFFCKSKVL